MPSKHQSTREFEHNQDLPRAKFGGFGSPRQPPFLYQGSTFFAARTILLYEAKGAQGHGRGTAWVTVR